MKQSEEQEHVQRVLISVVNFKRQYYNFLINSDRVRIQLWIQKLQDLEKIPVENGHFITCPWSMTDINIDGPDTCICSVPSMIEMKFNQLLNEYNIQML